MRDRKLNHIIGLIPQCDKIVIDSRLILAGVVEVETLSLHIIRRKFLHLKLCNLLQEPLLILETHSPDDHNTIVEEKHLRRMNLGIEIYGVWYWCFSRSVLEDFW